MNYSGPPNGMYFSCFHDYARALQESNCTMQPTNTFVTEQPLNFESNNGNQLETYSYPSYQNPPVSVETSQPATNEVDYDMMSLHDPLRWQGASAGFSQTANQQSFHNLSLGLEHQELIRNGLLPHLETMQLMRADSKRLRKYELTPQEDARKRIRREKNKVAAAKCRNKRREFSRNLKQDQEQTEKLNTELKDEVKELTAQIEQLQGVLESHDCVLNAEQLDEIQRQVELITQEERDKELETSCKPQDSDRRGESDDDTIMNSSSSSPMLTCVIDANA